jgi:hypothetical protein
MRYLSRILKWNRTINLCDASKVNVACEEALSVKEDGFAIVALSEYVYIINSKQQC